MSLKDQIEERSREIRTDGYSMSIGEVLSLCNDGDIDIHPEFQRIFRWKSAQKSRLIESILLGIPIPPIFVSQREDGVWDVIDGVQRLSTILEFTGNYRDDSGERLPGFRLEEGEYLGQMEGFTWESPEEVEGGEHPLRVFDSVLQRDFKRAKLEFRIITKGSDANAKYDLFQRLNAGSVLSQQEARNCLLVMMNREMFALVNDLSEDPDFLKCIQLSERQEEQAYREELVLRFFAQEQFTGGETELRVEHGEHLTEWMKSVASSEGISAQSVEGFRTVFNLIADALGDDAFRRWGGERHKGPFSISSYEFITSGLVANLEKWRGAPEQELAERIREVWSSEEFLSRSGTGVSARRRFPYLVNRARKFFE